MSRAPSFLQRRRYVGACLAVAVALAGMPAAAAERTLTVEDAVATGLQNSQEYLALQEQVAMAQQRINEAKALIYPRIDFNVSASRFNNAFPTVLSPSFNSIYLPQGTQDIYYTTGFSLWQYLYAGGRYTTTVRLAEINLSKAQSQADATRNKTVLDVKKSFYACRSAQEKIQAYEKALAEIAVLEEKGAAARARLQETDDRIRTGLDEARHEYEKSNLEFLHVAGIELNTVVELEGAVAPELNNYDLNKCLAQACRYRPELRQTQFEETIDSLRVNLSLTERYPTVTLGASHEWVGDQFLSGDKNWNATINCNVPVFDGWAVWARIRQRKNQAREGKLRRAKIEDQIRYEVRQAYLDYTYWQVRLQALSVQPRSQDPEQNLSLALKAADIRMNAVVSRATLEWATGNALKQE